MRSSGVKTELKAQNYFQGRVLDLSVGFYSSYVISEKDRFLNDTQACAAFML